MKKVFYLTLFMLFMLVNINIVDASACDSEDMARLKGLAAGVSYSSEYIGDKPGATSVQEYKVNFTGLTNEMYVSDSHYTFTVNSDSQTIKLDSGVTILEIYSKNCYDLRLKSIKIDLPKYNLFAIYDECQEEKNKNLDVCNPWYNGGITEDEFYDVIENNNTDNVSVAENLENVIVNNIYVVGISVVILLIFVIIFILFKVRKNRLE